MIVRFLQLKVTGLLGDDEVSELISAIGTDMVLHFVNEQGDELKTLIHPEVQKLLNNFLADKTISDIIKIIS